MYFEYGDIPVHTSLRRIDLTTEFGRRFKIVNRLEDAPAYLFVKRLENFDPDKP